MLELKNLRDGESVQKVIRRHWIMYVILCVYACIGISIFISIHIILGWTWYSILFSVCFWLLFCLFLYISWLNQELDLYVITTHRIIGIEQITFLNRTVSECNLGQVQEVNSKTKGFFGNMLNYGTLSIQTAGNKTTMKMDFCPDSIQEARKLLNIVDEYKKCFGV